ncbi:MAG: MmcB family DNA repair protein [Candidatus Methanofastidiosia archaeon]
MISESEMVEKIKIFFEEKGFKVVTEVPMLSKRIDVVCIKPQEDYVIAIEAKLRNWKKGIRQASTYRVGSDFVYLAIHRKFSHRVNKTLLKKASVGLIIVDQKEVEIRDSAPNHQIIHDRIRGEIVSYCGGENLARI